MEVRIKRLSETATLPTRASEGSAGYDLYVDIDKPVVIPHNATRMLTTNIAFEIPDGYFGAIYARSGLSTNHSVRPANCVGVIDSDYRGAVGVPLHNDSYVMPYTVHPGERVAQMIIMRAPEIELVESDELSETDRGKGGFGSSGK